MVTFTPLSPLPGNVTVTVEVSGVLDLSGNAGTSFYSSFTTGTGNDTVAPVVTMVTPQNAATGIGTNAPVVLTFSKSLNPSTVNAHTFSLLANGSEIGISNQYFGRQPGSDFERFRLAGFEHHNGISDERGNRPVRKCVSKFPK